VHILHNLKNIKNYLNILYIFLRINCMKLTKFLTFILPRFNLNALVMTAVLVASPNVCLALTVHDPLNFAKNLITAAESKIAAAQATLTAAATAAKNAFDASEVVRKLREVTATVNKVKDFQNDLNDKVNAVKQVKEGLGGGANDHVDYSLTKISGMYKSTATKLSDGAKKFFPNDAVCKSDKPIYATVIGSVISTTHTIQDKLEFNCVAQRELKAMAFQAAYDYAKVVTALKLNQESSLTTWSDFIGAESSQVSTSIAGQTYKQNLEAAEYERVKESITHQEQLLLTLQRDLEAELMRGRKGAVPTLVSAAVRAAAITGVLSGTGLSVDGNRQTNYKPTYAD
jgi:hypothetical protein